MKKLQLSFKTEDGKNRNLILNYMNESLDDITTKQAMGKIVASKIFSQKDVLLFAEALAAKYVDRVENPIF
ncbi:DUF2922 domain-containing protein [Companilactobacillus ginsenosidimutans]|uniref:DUF2922 domain-containing protein n=1 Tax=Companilactobacillus ginsenosidimutans TaxID=1007676 RepID=A0A0H4QH31_9LACO|nr:DUF2922 domain-containing protein [Companilactobacillus ginsenosidimutans]AKP67252.1 hypothetical protein ABM34_06665 [Companilactobacillus ginsenosidimutans]